LYQAATEEFSRRTPRLEKRRHRWRGRRTFLASAGETGDETAGEDLTSETTKSIPAEIVTIGGLLKTISLSSCAYFATPAIGCWDFMGIVLMDSNGNNKIA